MAVDASTANVGSTDNSSGYATTVDATTAGATTARALFNGAMDAAAAGVGTACATWWHPWELESVGQLPGDGRGVCREASDGTVRVVDLRMIWSVVSSCGRGDP